MLIVLGAAAALSVLLRTPQAAAVERRVFDSRSTLHAPHLIDLEIAQVVRRHTLSSALSRQRAEQALADWRDFTIQRYPHDMLLPRIWALRATLTAYDAAYIALAEALDAPLVTLDAKLAGAPGHTARVEVLS